MAYNEYRAALVSIATRESEGEDVGHAIAVLARRTGMDAANVRQEVTEFAELAD